MSNEKITLDRWIGLVLSVGMAVIALAGLYFQKVQVDGASGKLINELNEKLDKLQTSVNERVSKLEQTHQVAALEKQVADLKTVVADLRTKYQAPEAKQQLTDYSKLLTQKEHQLTLWPRTGTPTPSLSRLFAEQPAKVPETWNWLKTDDKKRLESILSDARKTRDLFPSEKPLNVSPLIPPPEKSFLEKAWETIKGNPVVVVIVIVLLILANRK